MTSFGPVYKNKTYNMKISMALHSFKQVANCVKIFQIRSFSGPYFPAIRQNTKRYGVSLRIWTLFTQCNLFNVSRSVTALESNFNSQSPDECVRCNLKHILGLIFFIDLIT